MSSTAASLQKTMKQNVSRVHFTKDRTQRERPQRRQSTRYAVRTRNLQTSKYEYEFLYPRSVNKVQEPLDSLLRYFADYQTNYY